MPSQDAKRAPDARRLSRRSLLHGVATAGAAGIAATAMSAGPAMAATCLPDGPITVHVHDARSGDIELFCGDSRTRLHDQGLAARITHALRHPS